MAQYDCIFKWTNQAAARADVVALAQMLPDDQGIQQFLRDRCIPDLQVWRASQDTTDASGNIVHSYLAGYFALVSVPRRIQAIEDDPALQLALDREKMNALITPFAFKTNLSAALLADIRFGPVFMGMDVPWGGLS